MPHTEEMPVFMPRADWERALATLNRSTDLTPIGVRMKDAIDHALNERIDEIVTGLESEQDPS